MPTHCDITYFTFFISLVAVNTLWPPGGQEDYSCALPMSSDDDVGCLFVWWASTYNFPFLATRDRYCTLECIHLLLIVIYNSMSYGNVHLQMAGDCALLGHPPRHFLR